MKFITFSTSDKKEHMGLIIEEGKVIDLNILGKSNPHFRSMLNFIRGGEEVIDTLKELLADVPEDAIIDSLENVRLLAPIPEPVRNIYCVGLNYAEHTAEFSGGKTNTTEHPIIFSKVPTTVIGQGDEIDLHPDVTKEVDYEAELGVIIGTGGRDIQKEDVYDHIFGYTIINDVTARDLQRKHQQWLLGKSLDTFCPIGPHIIHKSELTDPQNLDISCTINGEIRQSSNTKHMIFDIPEIISTISKGHTLQAGDIIATGTCEGVGMGFNPPRFLQKGDVIEVEIEKIGVLRNEVVTKKMEVR